MPACAQVLWETLNMRAGERYAWRMLGYPFIAFFLLFPVGLFLGGITQLANFVCRSDVVTSSGWGPRRARRPARPAAGSSEARGSASKALRRAGRVARSSCSGIAAQ
jgi:hypothetical protein